MLTSFEVESATNFQFSAVPTLILFAEAFPRFATFVSNVSKLPCIALIVPLIVTIL